MYMKEREREREREEMLQDSSCLRIKYKSEPLSTVRDLQPGIQPAFVCTYVPTCLGPVWHSPCHLLATFAQ